MIGCTERDYSVITGAWSNTHLHSLISVHTAWLTARRQTETLSKSKKKFDGDSPLAARCENADLRSFRPCIYVTALSSSYA